MSNNLFAIDIGGTDIKYGVVTPENDIISSGRIPTPYETPDHLVNLLIQLASQFTEQVRGIAVSLPGSPCGETGVVQRGGALKYLRGFPLGQALHKASGLPATLENDGRCAALGEYCAGALQNTHCGVMLVIGTSLGGGILLDGEILDGFQSFAGRFSHLLVEDSAGNLVRVGDLIGKEGLRRAVIQACHLPENTPLTGFDIFERINSGDTAAQKGLDNFCLPIALLISNLQVILDPDRIVLGGGISAQPALLESVQRQLTKLSGASPIPRPVSNVALSPLGNHANLLGAAEVWRRKNIRLCSVF